MGYFTYYKLEIYEEDKFPDGKPLSFDQKQKLLTSSSCAKEREVDMYIFDENIKWYSHNENMIEISKELSDYVFILYGDGEESEDNWKNVYYRGRSTGVQQETYYPAINMSKVGLTDPYDSSPPPVKPLKEYFWNKDEKWLEI